MINKIVIFDGDCAFCNKSVLFILRKNTKKDIFVVPSDSEKGMALIKEKNILHDPKETIIYIENNRVFSKSNAVLQISKSLKGGYPMLYVFKIIPRFVRDFVYDFIAKRRKRLIKGNPDCSFEMAQKYQTQIMG